MGQNNPTGIWNPSDFVSKANNFRTNSDGNKINYGDKWLEYLNNTVTNKEAKNYILNSIRDLMQNNSGMSTGELKYRLRALENNAKYTYWNKGIPKNFDISAGMLDSTMAKVLNSIDWDKVVADNTVQQPEPAKKPDATKQPQATQKPDTAKQPQTVQKPNNVNGITFDDEDRAAYNRLKQAKGTDADLSRFSKFTDEQLKQIGFGPKSIAAISGMRQSSAQPSTQQSQNKGLVVNYYGRSKKAPVVSGTKEDIEAAVKNGTVPKVFTKDSVEGATREELDAMKEQGLSDKLYKYGLKRIEARGLVVDGNGNIINGYGNGNGPIKNVGYGGYNNSNITWQK